MIHQTLHFVVPGDINARTGGYRYDKRIMQELIALGWTVNLVTLIGDYPFPSDEQLIEAGQILANIDDHSLVAVDGLAFSVMPGVIKIHQHRLNVVALIHHPLALETGLSMAQIRQLRELETQALSYVQRIITTSTSTADSLREYNVSADQIIAVTPGTDRGELATGSADNTLNLLCVATLTPRKGHSVLLDALAPLTHYKWRLSCAGSTERDPNTFQKLKQQADRLKLGQQVNFIGELNDHQLTEAYQQADVFVLASFHEGYGMVLDEAIAHGLPIVCTNAGAMKNTVPEGAALLVAPDDSAELSGAIKSVITDAKLRLQLTNRAKAARLQLRTWKQAAFEFAEALTF